MEYPTPSPLFMELGSATIDSCSRLSRSYESIYCHWLLLALCGSPLSLYPFSGPVGTFPLSMTCIPIVEIASPQVLVVPSSVPLTSTNITSSGRCRKVPWVFLITPHTQWLGGSPLFHGSSHSTSSLLSLTPGISPSVCLSSSPRTPSMNKTSPSLLELPERLTTFTLLWYGALPGGGTKSFLLNPVCSLASLRVSFITLSIPCVTRTRSRTDQNCIATNIVFSSYLSSSRNRSTRWCLVGR